ncbi:MAG: 50S ribosomal protein L23 [Vampirovibrionia bacterium]
MKNPRDIIKRPVITEKTSDFMAENKYVFEIDKKSNKTEVKLAIENIFGVKVKKVNVIQMPAKPKSYGKYNGYTSSWKKAIVTLTKDSKTIEFFEA